MSLKLLKKLARRINSLSSVLAVMKGLDLATQQLGHCSWKHNCCNASCFVFIFHLAVEHLDVTDF